jgi:MSHA pilin protein MshC
MSAPARGFTLVELIVVMVIVGILGSVAAARFFERTGFDAASYAEQAKALVRYGQKIAIAQQRNVFVLLDGGRIALCYQGTSNCALADRVSAPSGSNSASAVTRARCGDSGWMCEGRPDNLLLTLTPSTPYPAGAAYFSFDPLGKPYAAGDPVGVSSSFADLVLRVTGDGVNHDITVVPETGYVY